MRDPKQHAKRRQLLARGFSKSYLRQNWEGMVREKAEMAIGKIKRDALRGTADILKWWTFYTTDVIGHLSFGESFHKLEHEEVRLLNRCVVHEILITMHRKKNTFELSSRHFSLAESGQNYHWHILSSNTFPFLLSDDFSAPMNTSPNTGLAQLKTERA
jgi:cytochrome P450